MTHLNYVGVLAFIGICAVFVNLGFKLKIRRQWKAFVIADIGLMALYLTWDIWAVKKGSWYFDQNKIIGLKIFGVLPIEEVLFFFLVPLMVVLCYLSLTKIIVRVKDNK